ncbi:MAG: GMC oxidoreductase, partial [Gammaproteobacteria bacterium]|nr:GMC oxidoreductase [Gammaproteobacteria bacterium]
DQEIRPGPGVQTDDELIEDIRNRADTVFHPSCTCMMGPDAKTAVVDANCRVYGVERLRVVDTSVFPTLTSGNTNGPTIMVAEKAADLILDGRERRSFQ